MGIPTKHSRRDKDALYYVRWYSKRSRGPTLCDERKVVNHDLFLSIYDERVRELLKEVGYPPTRGEDID